MALTNTQIVEKLELLKSGIANDEIKKLNDVVEYLEDIICDANGDGCFDFDDMNDDFMVYPHDEPDFSSLADLDN